MGYLYFLADAPQEDKVQNERAGAHARDEIAGMFPPIVKDSHSSHDNEDSEEEGVQ